MVLLKPGASWDNFECKGTDHCPLGIGSGTLISRDLFLTTAHSIDIFQSLIEADTIEPVQYVSFSPEPGADPSSWLEFTTIVTHVGYNQNGIGWQYDIAVAILDIEQEGTQRPFVLPEPGYLDRQFEAHNLVHGNDPTEFIVVGYGSAYPTSLPPSPNYLDLRSAGTRRVGHPDFLALFDVWLQLSGNPNRGDSGTCWGDSGGPTLYEDPETSETVLVAMTAWGGGTCNGPDTQLRLDVPSTYDFVQCVLAESDPKQCGVSRSGPLE